MSGRELFKRFVDGSGLSQTETARKLGCSTAAVSRILGGSRSPCRRLALAIARLTEGAVPIESWDEPATSPSGAEPGARPPAETAEAVA